MVKIGIAEDDNKIAFLLTSALSENGYDAFAYANGSEALDAFNNNAFDLLIVDIMMPGLNGVQLCQELRRQNVRTPILMLTAMGTVDDKVTGLDAGADDYLVKPFHLKELMARVSALLRRHQTDTNAASTILTFDDLSMNLESKEVTRAGIQIDLSAREFALLELFLRNPNKLLSRQFIADRAWDINFDTGTNVIDVYINFLRKKVEKGFERKLIHTKINMGYIMK